MQLEHKTGVVIMSVERADDDKILSITFFNHETGFGALATAEVYAHVMPESTPIPGPGQEITWVSTERLVGVLAGLVRTRAGLALLPDFEGFMTDAEGVPSVLRHTLFCVSCGHSWVADEARITPKFICPRCRSVVEALNPAVTWHGPEGAIFETLWKQLPATDDDRRSLASGLELVETEDGFVLGDAFGHQMRLSTATDGFRLAIHARNSTAPVAVAVGLGGVTVTTTAGEKVKC